MSAKPTLGYWNVRGLGQPIRLTLAYLGVDFEDKQYAEDEEWFDPTSGGKATVGREFDFPNLPYLIDGDVRLTQSVAILRYLGRKYQIDGTTEEEKARIDLVEQQVADLTKEFYEFVLKPNYLELKKDFLKKLQTQLEQITKYVGDRKTVTGDAISYVDFVLYELFVKVQVFAPEVLEQFAVARGFMRRIEQLPGVAKFRAQQGQISLIGYPDKWDGKY